MEPTPTQLISDALEREDVLALRQFAAREGGFLTDDIRKRVWPFLLGVYPDVSSIGSSEVEPSVALASRPASPVDIQSDLASTSSALSNPPSCLGESWIHSSESTMTSLADSISQESNRGCLDSGGDDSCEDAVADDSSEFIQLGTSILASPIVDSASLDTHATTPITLNELDGSPLDETPSSSPVEGSVDISEALPSSSLQPLTQEPGVCSPKTFSSSKTPTPVTWGHFASQHGESLEPHPDEGQVKLDTRRGFVVYPPVEANDREILQTELHALIVTVLRRHRPLRYFQGYHDIASVFLLTFIPLRCLVPARRQLCSRSSSQARCARSASKPDGTQTSSDPVSTFDVRLCEPAETAETPLDPTSIKTLVDCLERVSLFRIRDGMGSGLEPVMGLLRVMKRLLKLADPELYRIVNQATPLPFFALSWLLTLFSHDVDSFPHIQLLFDFLLANNPVVVVYLSVAIILSKKELILSMKELLAEDPGILHSTLSELPPFISSTPSSNPLPATSPLSTPTEKSTVLPISLPDLFDRTIRLQTRFPVLGPDLQLDTFMGPQSVVFTYEAEWARKMAHAGSDKAGVADSVQSSDANDDDDDDDDKPGHENTDEVQEAEQILLGPLECIVCSSSSLSLSDSEDEDTALGSEKRTVGHRNRSAGNPGAGGGGSIAGRLGTRWREFLPRLLLAQARRLGVVRGTGGRSIRLAIVVLVFAVGFSFLGSAGGGGLSGVWTRTTMIGTEWVGLGLIQQRLGFGSRSE
ncbi:Predicted GTPase activator protein [Phaffia rhodozyma]|uniref:Predicted GTPase activator protein n=1 Tax=Phaffia rhodozyma TaxID=264483 RepID=A0A0F7SV31_PHARH|nr:Predicted GTPase activator protein [Phaffia rhodozyma]